MDPMHIFYSIQNDMNAKMGFGSVKCFNDASVKSSFDSDFDDACNDLGLDDAKKSELIELYGFLPHVKMPKRVSDVEREKPNFSELMAASNTPTTGINPEKKDVSYTPVTRIGKEDAGVIPSEEDMDVTSNFTSHKMKMQNFKVDNLIKSARSVMLLAYPNERTLNKLRLKRCEYNELRNLVKYALSPKSNHDIELGNMDAVSLIQSLNGIGFDASRDSGNWKDAADQWNIPRNIDGSDISHRKEVFKNIISRLGSCYLVKSYARKNVKRNLSNTDIKDKKNYSNDIPADDGEFYDRLRDLLQDVCKLD